MDEVGRIEFEYMKIHDQRTALSQYISNYFNGGILYSSAILVAFIGFGKTSGVAGATHPLLFVVGGIISISVLFMTILLISSYERAMVSLYPRIVAIELLLNYHFFRHYLLNQGGVYKSFVDDCNKLPQTDATEVWESVRKRGESLQYDWKRTTIQLRMFVIYALLVMYIVVVGLMVWASDWLEAGSYREMVVIRVVLTVSAMIAIFVGLDYLLAPESAILSFDLGDATLPARFFARATGAAILAIGVINIFTLAVGDAYSLGLRIVVIGNIVFHIADIASEFSESFDRNPVFWIAAGLHIIFIIAFGYLLTTSLNPRVN
jgi:hypothetical protein